MTKPFRPLNEMKPDEMVEEYYQIDHYLTVEQEKLTKFLEPANQRIRDIKSKLHEMMTTLGVESLPTKHGTPYFTTTHTPKIENEIEWIDFCMENWDGAGKDLFAVSKPKIDGVREWMKTHDGELPPHISVSAFTSLRIKKA